MNVLKRGVSFVLRQTKVRPFLSALFVLIMVVVPGFVRQEQTINKTRDNTSNLQHIINTSSIDNCRLRNTAARNTKETFEAFFTVFETIVNSNPEQTKEQRAQADAFFKASRESISSQDVDCDRDGKVTKEDYNG